MHQNKQKEKNNKDRQKNNTDRIDQLVQIIKKNTRDNQYNFFVVSNVVRGKEQYIEIKPHKANDETNDKANYSKAKLWQAIGEQLKRNKEDLPTLLNRLISNKEDPTGLKKFFITCKIDPLIAEEYINIYKSSNVSSYSVIQDIFSELIVDECKIKEIVFDIDHHTISRLSKILQLNNREDELRKNKQNQKQLNNLKDELKKILEASEHECIEEKLLTSILDAFPTVSLSKLLTPKNINTLINNEITAQIKCKIMQEVYTDIQTIYNLYSQSYKEMHEGDISLISLGQYKIQLCSDPE
jgi:hypothetical protein